MIRSIDHMVITTADLDACLHFYEDLLGIEHKVEGGQHALHFGDQKINLHTRPHEFHPSATNVTHGSQDFCLIADGDIYTIKEKLIDAGITIIEGVVERYGARGLMDSIYMYDPDGNLVEIAVYKYDEMNTGTNAVSPLHGKTILFLGSSVTYGFAAEGQSFVELFETLDGVHAIKEAKNGTTLVDKTSASALAEFGNGDSYIKRLKMIDTAAHIDCVLCQLSTNDATQKLPLGEISKGTDLSVFDTLTVTGAMEYVIAYSRETWGCPVVFYTGAYYDSDDYAAMVARLLELKDKWGIGVIDLYTDKEFNDIDKDTYNSYMADPVHPTKAGYAEWWMPEMESEMIRIMSEQN